jgi:hypothetical protein
MGNMEGKEPTHLQEPKLAGREGQGNNNIHDKGNGTELQLADKRSETHRLGVPHSRSLRLKDGRNPNQVRRPAQLQVGERNWKPPPVGSLKMNFDEVSKGNPGRTRMGGVIRDSKGNIIRLDVGSLGNSTNNAAEFGAWRPSLRF